jgi:hypothetical protein
MTMEMRRLVNFRVGGLLVGVGLACGFSAAFMLVSSVGSAFNDSFLRHPCATPCSEVLDLDAGHYLVFEQIGRSTSIGPLSSTTQGPATISPADVAVTSPTGRTLAVAEPSSSQTIDRNGAMYGGVVSFHVPEAGRYRVSVDAPGERRVLVAPGLGQTFLKALPGVVVAGLGFVAGVTGLVVLIVAWIRRRSAARAT